MIYLLDLVSRSFPFIFNLCITLIIEMINRQTLWVLENLNDAAVLFVFSGVVEGFNILDSSGCRDVAIHCAGMTAQAGII